MKIVHIGTAVYVEEPIPQSPGGSKAKHDGILADLNAPVYLGSTKKLNYDHKSDRYIATFFLSDGETLTLKVPNDVAAFIAEHISKAGYWLGRMEDGALVDAYLIQPD